ncbi:MAG: OmpH family outer membrane protein [Flavobacteriales bacterium]
MKNLSSILNVILLLAVAVLFYLHFSSTKEQSKPVVVENNTPSVLTQDSLTQFMNLDSNIAAKPIKIAYVHNDSLTVNLDMLRDVEARIAKKEKDLQFNAQSKQKSFKRRLESEMDKYTKSKNEYTKNSYKLNDEQLKAENIKLAKMEQKLMEMNQSLERKLYEFQQKQEQEYMYMKAREMGDYYLKVQSFCKSFAKTLGFDFIMIYQPGGSFLYTNDEYDVTSYVVDAINKEYSQNKSMKVEEGK